MKNFQKIFLLVMFACMGNLWPESIPWQADTQSPNPIPAGDNFYFIDNTVTLTQDLTISGTLIVYQGGTLNSAFQILNNGVLNIWGGVWNHSASNVNNGYTSGKIGLIQVGGGTANLSAGTVNGCYSSNTSSIITVTAGAVNQSGANVYTALSAETMGYLRVSGGEYKITAGSVFNGGASDAAYIHTGTGQVDVSGSGIITVDNTGAFESPAYYYGYTGTAYVHDGGTVNLKNGIIYNGTVKNGSFIVGQNGTFNMSGGTFENGCWPGESAPGIGLFKVYGGTVNQTGGTINNALSLAGTLGEIDVAGGGQFNVANGLINNGCAASTTAAITVSGGATLSITGTGIINNAYASAATITVSGANLNLTGTLQNNVANVSGIVTVTWSNLNFTGTWSAMYPANEHLQLFSADGADNAKGTGKTLSLISTKTMRLASTDTVTFGGSTTLSVPNGASLINAGSLTFSSATLSVAGTATNSNVFTVTHGGSLSFGSATSNFYNNGLINLYAGGITISNGNCYSGFDSRATWTINAGGTLTLSGGNFYHGNTGGSGSIIDVLPNATLSASAGNVYNGYSGLGIINISGGLFNMSGSTIKQGYSNGVTGTTNIYSGELRHSGGEVTLAPSGGYAALNIYGGAFNRVPGAGTFFLGRDSGYAQINQTAGIINNSSGDLYTAFNGASAVISMYGGTFNHSGGNIFNSGTNNRGNFNIYGGTYNNFGSAVLFNGGYFGSVSIGYLDIAYGGVANIMNEMDSPYPQATKGSVIIVREGGQLNVSGKILNGGQNGGAPSSIDITNGASLAITGTGILDNHGSAYAGSLITISDATLLVTGTLKNATVSNVLNGPSSITITGTSNFDYSGSFVVGTGNSNIKIWSSGNDVTVADRVMTMIASTTMSVPSGAKFKIGPANKLVCNSTNKLSFAPGSGLLLHGIIDSSGSNCYLFDQPIQFAANNITVSANSRLVIPVSCLLQTGTNIPVNVLQGAELLVSGTLTIDGNQSQNIYGLETVTGLLNNGDGTYPGTINVYYPGTLLIPGGSVVNGNANSTINVKRGGTILNYYGTLDTTIGTCTVAAGGLISNEMGIFNYTDGKITFSQGAMFFERANVELMRNLDLDFTWTITVPATINGGGRSINFLSGGALQISPGASLLLEDVILNGINGNCIRCFDNSATLSLRNVVWMQDTNYSFTVGQIDILGDVVVQGPNTGFAYSSTMTSTIHHNASLLFDMDTTFSYLSTFSTGIAMDDKSSVLAFDSSKLYAGATMRQRSGTILFDNAITLSAGAGKTIYFGNSAQGSAFDVDISLLAEATVAMYGNVVVDNVGA